MIIKDKIKAAKSFLLIAAGMGIAQVVQALSEDVFPKAFLPHLLIWVGVPLLATGLLYWLSRRQCA